ncbi:hypothetical protein [Variovorax paradoxus]|uniref:Uncharacterized protein n=1 Tax=Variovorax paradoxus TaxID=34073 RepID=A0A6I6HFB5_VARPD|nr:hypothetical protein [Variovorax paradoxus]QGW82234.1 hypothetical protein GOQ09_11870 [Variovorax paradoxus]
MFEIFEKEFSPDADESRSLAETLPASGDDRLDQLFARYGGVSFNQGLYRVISVEAVSRWG